DGAVRSADLRLAEGVRAGGLNVSTLKSLDEHAICRSSREPGSLRSLENHSVIGGLGSAVTDTLCRAGLSVAIEKTGIRDHFVECGSVPYLNDKHGLSVRHVVQEAKKVLSRRC